MTANQIAYWNVVEYERHNKASEAETYRHNSAQEVETNRHNVVMEVETNRHNVVTERETERHNRATEAIGWSQAAASHKMANAALMNAETERMYKSSEMDLKWYKGGVELGNDWYDMVNTHLENTRRLQIQTQEMYQGWANTAINGVNALANVVKSGQDAAFNAAKLALMAG